MEKPPIRILQRPCHTSAKNKSEVSRPPATVKTLEQREADYAAARRRIMESDIAEPEGESVSTELLKGTTTGIVYTETSALNQTLNMANTNVTSAATPLMSIQAAPGGTSGISSDFRFSSATTTGLSVASVGQPRTTYSARQVLSSLNAIQKLQQPQPITNGMRHTSQHPQRTLTASNSSPSLIAPSSRTSQPVPLFAQFPNTSNTGLLPTPPGFNYSSQNASVNDGVGLHHTHAAALTLMQHFNLLQQYQQPMNGFHHLLSPALSHTNPSINHLNFASVGSLTGINQKHAHPSTFN